MGKGGDVIFVAAIINHPNFDRFSLDYDFALLRLKSKIVLNGVTKAAIKLPSASDVIKDGTNVLVSGWGLTKKLSESNAVLRGVEVPTHNQEKCRNAYRYDGEITQRMVCAGSFGKDSCNVSFTRWFAVMFAVGFIIYVVFPAPH